MYMRNVSFAFSPPLSCFTFSPQRWCSAKQVSIVIFSVSPFFFFLSFLSVSTFLFLGQWTMYPPTGGKTTKATLSGQKKTFHIKSHCKTAWIYTVAPVGESERQNTNTYPFQSPSTKHYLTLLHCEGRLSVSWYMPLRIKSTFWICKESSSLPGYLIQHTQK